MTLINIYILSYDGYISYTYESYNNNDSSDTCLKITTTSGIVGIHERIDYYSETNTLLSNFTDIDTSKTWKSVENTYSFGNNLRKSDNSLFALITGTCLIVIGLILCCLLLFRINIMLFIVAS